MSASDIKLKGCPLKGCPCDGDTNPEALEYEHHPGEMRVTCACGVAGPWSNNFDEAADGWNEEMPRATTTAPCPDCGLHPSPDGHFEGGCQCATCPECGKPTDRGPYNPCEACELGPTATHEQLWAVCRKLPTDYKPYGDRSNDERGGDCSTSCKWFHELVSDRGMDWGVCFNPASPRAGLLTFEHQGCRVFEYEPDDDEEDDDE
jgi:hypothetical protein